MDFSLLKFPIRDLEKIESLRQLRERLLTLLLHAAFVLATVLYLVALVPVTQKGLTIPPLIYTVLYIWLGLIAFEKKRIPYIFRAGSWAIFFYVLGVVNLGMNGLNVDSGLFFLSYVLMTALFFDLKQGMVALGICAGTITLFGYTVINGLINPGLALPQSAPLLWIIGGMIFVIAAVLLILPLSVLMRGLVGYLEKAKDESEVLKNANLALRLSEERYRSLVEISPDLITLIGLDGKVILANKPGMALFGYEETDFVGRDYMLFVAPAERPRITEEFRSALEIGSSREVACQCLRKDGTLFDAEFSGSLVKNEDGVPEAVIVVGRDVTERRNAERLLENVRQELEIKVMERTAEQRESEETWRILMNATPSSLLMLDSDGRLIAANKPTTEKMGLKLENVLGKIIYEFFPEELAVSRKERVDEIFRTGEYIEFEDYRAGHWFENHLHPILNDQGKVIRIVVVAREMTERKLLEQSLIADKDYLEARVAERTWELTESREQLRNLTTEMISAQEEERRRISRELHDEAGQALVSMKYGLESILADLSGKNLPIKKRLTSAIQQLDETMEQIRFLAHSLRPPLLDIADLDLTLRDYCLEFGESTGLQVNYTGDAAANLNDQTGIAFFRFLQEALTNVVKHASATRVQVRLKKRGSHLSLIVADNGMGHKESMNQGQGHIGMQERFRMLGGQVRIRSLSGVGFTILARVPYGEELADNQQDA